MSGSDDLFSHHSNIDVKNRFVVYDIKDIGSGLKELGLQIAFDAIWNKMIENRAKGKRTWIYIDEFYLLMSKETSAEYISTIWKRARMEWCTDSDHTERRRYVEIRTGTNGYQ